MAERKLPVASDLITRQWFDELVVEMRHIDAVEPATDLILYGEHFSTPIMTAALSHFPGQTKAENGLIAMSEGARRVNAVNWCGMGDTEEFDAIAATKARTIKIIKPYADEAEVLTRMEHAEAAGALAVGMDLDHSFNSSGKPDCVYGLPMRPRTAEEIAAYVRRTKLPFIVKGVLSAEDAKKCLYAGVQGIVVSHHHGIMASAIPPLMILPEIVKAVHGAMPVFVDCGIQNGMDAFKALALGAAAVSVGRVIMPPIQAEGADGAEQMLRTITDELRGVMAHTATRDIRHIDSGLIWHRSGRRIIP